MEEKQKESCGEIAVYGKEDFLLGFMLVGIKHVYTEKENTTENVSVIKNLLHDSTAGVLVVQEEAYHNLPVRSQEDLSKSIKPVTVILSKESGIGRLREIIIKSIGVDLWNQ
ncbi:V-type ATP synthase subunit F [Candidatus Woesearchaeota archaeon]|nr:V-type ATP synthase subunit F [Candidatus Woesearchaeota archaeon]